SALLGSSVSQSSCFSCCSRSLVVGLPRETFRYTSSRSRSSRSYSGRSLRSSGPSHDRRIAHIGRWPARVASTFACRSLGRFVALLHTSGYSSEAGIFLLTIWAVRLFPPVLGAVCVYRLWVEPRILPSLEAWCSTEAIQVRSSLPEIMDDWAKGARAPRRP